jgi:hypothetical protein
MPDSVVLVSAHKHCSRHRAEVLASENCGCCYCECTFEPEKVEQWTDAGQTALCPYCGIDAVIGSAAGYELTPEFLAAMHKHWF